MQEIAADRDLDNLFVEIERNRIQMQTEQQMAENLAASKKALKKAESAKSAVKQSKRR